MPRVKKAAVTRRPRTGVGAIPTDSFERAKFHIHYELAAKDGGQILKDYIRSIVSKSEMTSILRHPEYKFTMPTHYIAAAFWKMRDLPCDEREMMYIAGLDRYVGDLRASTEVESKSDEVVVKKRVLTPAEMLKRKINRTIMVDLDALEDAWIEGETKSLDLYNAFRVHDLKGSACATVRPVIEGWLSDYSDAKNKSCDQAVEGYAHLTTQELTRRIKECEQMLADLDSIAQSSKAQRTVKTKKPKSVTSQTRNLKYLKESNEFKLTSINPISVVGAMRLLTFNIKTRTLTEYISEHPDGFEVSGTSLKRFDADLSRSKKLRKPEEFLPMAQKKTPKQFSKEFDALTTKAGVPNGRINADTILLKVK